MNIKEIQLDQLEKNKATLVAQIIGQGSEWEIELPKTVLSAFRKVNRHEFLPEDVSIGCAYADEVVILNKPELREILRQRGVGENDNVVWNKLVKEQGSTASQPSLLAYELLRMDEIFKGKWVDKRVLEVGCGTGYLAALMLEMGVGGYVGVEINSQIADQALNNLDRYKQCRVSVIVGDGVEFSDGNGFDLVVVSAGVGNGDDLLSIMKLMKVKGAMLAPVDKQVLEEVFGNVVYPSNRADKTWLTAFWNGEAGIDVRVLMAVNFVALR